MKEELGVTEVYGRYRQLLDTTPFNGKGIDYERNELPKPLDFAWMPYGLMFDEFSRELANSLNQLMDYTHRLKTWNLMIASMGDNEKLTAVHEFIDPVGTVGLNLPYVIRSRFIVAAAHLCHQANQSRSGASWKDDIPPDDKIYFDTADKCGAGWRSYNRFKLSIEKIGNKAYQEATGDFRNAYNHRFSPHFVIGLTQFVTRKVDAGTGKVTYSLGNTPALSLDVVVKLLIEQGERGAAAFEAFLTLVREHAARISP
jgi:hypothetical protein